MKKLLALLLIILILLPVVSCGVSEKAEDLASTTTGSTKGGYVDSSVYNGQIVGGGTDSSVVQSSLPSDKISIVFNANGGYITSGGYSVAISVGGALKSSSLPSVERDGYTFAGWAYDKQGASMWDESHTFNKTDMLYARWRKDSGTTTGTAAGGTVDTGSGVASNSGSTIDTSWGNTTDTTDWGNTTDTTGWGGTTVSSENKTVTVYFCSPDGSIHYSDFEIPYGGSLDDYDLPTITETGYAFVGWSYTSNAYEPYFWTRGDRFFNDTVFYAVWEKKQIVDPPPVGNTKWEGQTVNILATVWETSSPSAPWSQVELTVADDGWYDDSNFGQMINASVLQRNQYIMDNYGIELRWINARSSRISEILAEGVASASGTTYHIAMPRMNEVTSIVANNSVYAISNRKYINLNHSYYSQASVEAFTAWGNTLFAAGDFSFLDESSSYVTYLNTALTEGFYDFPDVYQLVRAGNWTVDQMINIARLYSKNAAEAEWTDDDYYGYGTSDITRFYQYGGIKQVTVIDGEFINMLFSESSLSEIMSKITEITSAEFARNEWTGGDAAAMTAFGEGRLLFYDGILQELDYFAWTTDDFKVSVLPTPKLNSEQDAYYTPCSEMSVVMCVPKTTDDREFSDFCFELLASTGKKFLMDAYYRTLSARFDPEIADECMSIIESYILPGIVYDLGYTYGENGLYGEAQELLLDTFKSSFDRDYLMEIYGEAALELDNWNLAWLDYYE